MTNLKNELPVAVHQVSGGDARVKVDRKLISLSGISTGSFVVENATRYSIYCRTRGKTGTALVVGYTSHPDIYNCVSVIGEDMIFYTFTDDVPSGTVVYFTLIHGMTLAEVTGTANDNFSVTFYN